MTGTPVRMDGWKAIAAHLRRSRNTVMRWAQDGDFPVRRVTGKKGASVWAYAHELDAWITNGEPAATAIPGDVNASLDTVGRLARASAPGLGPVTLAAISAILLAAAVVVVVALSRIPVTPARWNRSLPADHAVAELYLQARDDWATRTPQGLSKAQGEFGGVISRDPGFALAYTGLADVFIAAHDYAAMPARIAFPKAQAAARAALAIDPDNADANRVLGFVDYWGRHDIRAAREHFGRSLQIDPGSAQTHFWFGSTLSDFGAYEESMRELRAARLLDPGSKVIELYYAWSLWLRGPGDPGVAELEGVAAHGGPNLAHALLSDVYLSKGNVTGFLDQNGELASLLGDAESSAYVAAERAAYRQGGSSGLIDLIARRPRPTGLAGPSWADLSATLMSMEGRRDRLLAILTRAGDAGERWPTWRPDQARYARWRSDRAVMDALQRVIQQPVR